MTKEELRAYEIAPLSKIIPNWDGLSISVKAVIETSFNLEWWRGYHAPRPTIMRHVRMGQPAPEGDTHVIIGTIDYENWRGLLVMERQMVLAQTIEIQRVKALLRDLLEVSFPAIGADPDTEMYLRQKYDEVTGRAKNLLGIKDDKS